MTDEARHIVGWLAEVLQRGDHPGILAAADQVTYQVVTGAARERYAARTDCWGGPVVSVQWRGGPLADVVACALSTVRDPPAPVTLRDAGVVESRAHRDVIVGEVWVMLGVVEPCPDARGDRLRVPRPWRWPTPLAEDGAAHSIVIWQLSPDPDTGMATVLQVPSPPHPDDDRLIVDLDHDLPEWAGSRRRAAYDHARRHASIRLRTAEDAWELRDCERWAESEVLHLGIHPGVIAVRVARTDQTYLRVFTGQYEPGIGIVATPVGNHTQLSADIVYDPWDELGLNAERRKQSWTYLAPAVLSAALHQLHRLPGHIALCPLGPLHGSQWLFQLDISILPALLRNRGSISGGLA